MKQQEEKQLTKAEVKAFLVRMEEDQRMSLIYAKNRKTRMEDLLKRPSVKKLSSEKRARLSRRLLTASAAIETVADKLEKIQVELRNL